MQPVVHHALLADVHADSDNSVTITNFDELYADATIRLRMYVRESNSVVLEN